MLKQAKAEGTRGQLSGRDATGRVTIAPPENRAPSFAAQGISKRQASDWQHGHAYAQRTFANGIAARFAPSAGKKARSLDAGPPEMRPSRIGSPSGILRRFDALATNAAVHAWRRTLKPSARRRRFACMPSGARANCLRPCRRRSRAAVIARALNIKPHVKVGLNRNRAPFMGSAFSARIAMGA
jgi:hypothetical protein